MHNFVQSLNHCWNRGKQRKACLGLLGVALLCLALGAAAVNQLWAQAPDPAPRATGRTGWYFRSGQWQADLRTLAAAYHYVMADDPATPAVTNLANKSATDGTDMVRPQS
jgi:hypothetical protein